MAGIRFFVLCLALQTGFVAAATVSNVVVVPEGAVTATTPSSIQVTFRPGTTLLNTHKVVLTAKNNIGLAFALFNSDGSTGVPTFTTPALTISTAAISGTSTVYTFETTGTIPNTADAVITIPSSALTALPAAGTGYEIEISTTANDGTAIDGPQASGGTFNVIAAPIITWTGPQNHGTTGTSLQIQITNPTQLGIGDIIEITASQAIFQSGWGAVAESFSAAVDVQQVDDLSTFQTNAGGTVLTFTIVNAVTTMSSAIDITLSTSSIMALLPSSAGAVILTIKMGSSGSPQTVLNQYSGWLTISTVGAFGSYPPVTNAAVAPEGLVTATTPNSILVTFRPITALKNTDKVVLTAKYPSGPAVAIFGSDGTATVPTFSAPSLTISSAVISSSSSVYTFTVTGAVPNNADAVFSLPSSALAALPVALANYEVEISTIDTTGATIDTVQVSGGTFTVIPTPTITWTGSQNHGKRGTSLQMQVTNPATLAIGDIIEITASQAIFTGSISATAESASSTAVVADQVNDASTYQTNVGGDVFTITIATAATSASSAIDITLSTSAVMAALPSSAGAVTLTIKMGTSGSLSTVLYGYAGWLTISTVGVSASDPPVTNAAIAPEGVVTATTPNSILVTFRPTTALKNADKVVLSAKDSGGSAAAIFGSDGAATVPTFSTPSLTITLAVISSSSSVYTFTVTGAVPNNADASFALPSGALGALPAAGANYEVEISTTDTTGATIDTVQASGGTFTIIASPTITWFGSENHGTRGTKLQIQMTNPATLAIGDIIEITASQAIFTASISATAESASSTAVVADQVNDASTYQTNAGGTVFTITIATAATSASSAIDISLSTSAVMAPLPSNAGAVTLTIKMGTSGSLSTVLHGYTGWLTISTEGASGSQPSITNAAVVLVGTKTTSLTPTSIQVTFRPTTALENTDKVVLTAKDSSGSAAVVFGSDGAATVPTFTAPSLTISSAVISSSSSVYTFTVTGAVPNNADAVFSLPSGALGALPGASANYEIEISTADNTDAVMDAAQTSGGTFTIYALPQVRWTGKQNHGNRATSLRVQLTTHTQLAINDLIKMTASQAIFTSGVSATAISASSGAVSAASVDSSSTYETTGGTIFTITVLTASTAASSAVDITLSGASVLALLPSVSGAVTLTIELGTSGSLEKYANAMTGWLSISTVGGSGTDPPVTNVAVGPQGLMTSTTPTYIQVTFRPTTALQENDKVVLTAKDSGGSAAAIFGSDTTSATVATFTTPTVTVASAVISSSGSVYTFVMSGAVPNSADATFKVPSGALAQSLPAAGANYEIEVSTTDTTDVAIDTVQASGGTYTIYPTPSVSYTGNTNHGNVLLTLVISFTNPAQLNINDLIEITASQAIFASSVSATAESAAHESCVIADQVDDSSTFETNGAGTIFTMTVKTAATAISSTIAITLAREPILAPLPSNAGPVYLTVKLGSSGSLETVAFEYTGFTIETRAGYGSDPVARFGDVVRLFELPPHELTPLMAAPQHYGSLGILGSVFEGGKGEQWFDRTVLTFEDQFLDIKMKPNLHEMNQSRIPRGFLKTIDVTWGTGSVHSSTFVEKVPGHPYEFPHGFLGSRLAVRKMERWWRSTSYTTVGNFPRECVELGAQFLHLYICSTAAIEYFGDQRHLALKYAHLDLLIIEMSNVKTFRGLLPELWGVQPMSESTKAYVKEQLPDKPEAQLQNRSEEASIDITQNLTSDCLEQKSNPLLFEALL